MSLRQWVGEVRDGLLDLVFAPVCAACGTPVPTSEPERLVCRVCWSRARPVPPPRCERCWGALVPGRHAGPPCTGCEHLPAGIRVVRSALRMDDVTRRLVHSLKYRGWSALAEPMGRRLADLPFPPDVEEEARVVVPVPTSGVRLRERGYNQAALLAAVL
ncbi:MAG TPA: double zinc ribbon domain-containing protein, partial [Longimicrobiaceae bacterium]|nr:double zinc ribbon domain-containing protein [Longimicrobiaceae bacterium]